MNNNQLTTSQRKGIQITDRDLCIVAGPGSGKTSVLVKRFVNLVTRKNVSINEILTLTFTEKAANEMKIRVAALFEREGMEKERQKIEFAYLSTIHSFCARLLRENAIEAGIDPQFRVMDELETNRFKEQILETILKKWSDESRLDVFLNNIFWHQMDSKSSRIKSFKECLMHLYEKIRNACQPISKIVKPINISQDVLITYNNIKDIISEINELSSEKELPEKTRDKIEYILKRWNTLTLQKNIDELYNGEEKDTLTLSLLNKFKDINSSINLSVSQDVKQPLKDLRKELENLIGLLIEDYSTKPKMVLKEFLMDFDAAYTEGKKIESLVDFTDLEEKTIELLREKKHITDEIKRRFKYILVDEFQDISRLQRTIIDLIRGKDNLFVVGDAKQSIYGFRNADVEIFQNLQNEVSSSSLICLNENFRSRPQILDFVNHIFDKLWSDNAGNQQKDCNEIKDAANCSITSADPFDSTSPLSPPSQGGERGEVSSLLTNSEHQLKAGATFSHKSIPSVEMIMAAGEDKTQARKWESIEIAKRIKEIVEKGLIKITNKREKERNLLYRDFAILFRSTTDIKLYERSLAELNIPYYVISGRGFFNTTEITDLMNLLKVIESPLDEINLASVLKSPFVGVDDEALFWLANYAHNAHNGNERRYIYEILNEVVDIKEIKADVRNKITQFMQLLKKIQTIKPRTSLWHLISLILKRTEFQSKMLIFSNGKRRYANLLKLVELCKNQEDFEPVTLRDFIEIVEDYKFREIRESEAPVESEEEDVVKLTTVHAAKGLEFPVVVIADVDRDNVRPSDYFVYSEKHGVSFKIINPLTNEVEEPLSHKKIKEEIKEKEIQESKRLLYVAMTRAQEHLIISGGTNKGRNKKGQDKGNWFNDIYSILDLSMVPKENPEIIRLNGDKQRIRCTIITEENKPPAQLVSGIPNAGKRKSLLTKHKEEIAACNEIKTPPPSKDIINTGTDILSVIKHAVPVDNSHYVYSVTEILKFYFCPQLYFFTYILGLRGTKEGLRPNPESEEDANTPYDDEIPGHELGNIAHRVLKRYHLSENKVALQEHIKREFATSGFEADQSRINMVASWVNSFYESEVGKEVVSGSLQKREASFIFKHQHNLIRGQFDLFYCNNAGQLKIIDYKANDISVEEIPLKVKYYQLQMQLYARALEAIYGKRVDETILYFLVPNKSVTIDTTEDSCKELYKTLDTFFATLKKGNFKKVSNYKCEWCEYEMICK
ncbi:MAG: UvrD-helicase domain-containing protein [Candidatus Scalinduaceae bacterium]